MADSNAKQAYPTFPKSTWWKLRDQFNKRIPATVDVDYLRTVLGVEAKTARNLLPQLRVMGLIDEDGKPTERANHWRFDEDYPEVCRDIITEVYPEALLHAVPDPENNVDAVVKWFKRNAGVGDAAAKIMAAFLQLLGEADPAKKPEGGRSEPRQAKAPRQTRVSQDKKIQTAEKEEEPRPDPSISHGAGTKHQPVLQNGLSLHLDIRIHISADSKPERIDQIFASMAKHLYSGVSGGKQ